MWIAIQGNIEREVTNSELCKELSAIADREKLHFGYKGKERSFAQRMSNLRAGLGEFFEIHEREGGARKRFFRFIPKQREE